MTTNKSFTHLENSARRGFIIKGTMISGGLMLGVGSLPDDAHAQTPGAHDPNMPT